jgi:hypothetical protein
VALLTARNPSAESQLLKTIALRPFMDISSAALLLGLHESQALELVDSGAIPWAFDISLTTRNRCLRVFVESVLAYGCGKSVERSLAEILDKTTPAGSSTIAPRNLAFRLHCSRTHVLNAVRASCFPGISKLRDGAVNPIPCADVRAWLQKRRVV